MRGERMMTSEDCLGSCLNFCVHVLFVCDLVECSLQAVGGVYCVCCYM